MMLRLRCSDNEYYIIYDELDEYYNNNVVNDNDDSVVADYDDDADDDYHRYYCYDDVDYNLLIWPLLAYILIVRYYTSYLYLNMQIIIIITCISYIIQCLCLHVWLTMYIIHNKSLS